MKTSEQAITETSQEIQVQAERVARQIRSLILQANDMEKMVKEHRDTNTSVYFAEKLSRSLDWVENELRHLREEVVETKCLGAILKHAMAKSGD